AIIGVLILVLGELVLLHFRSKKLNRQKFEALMQGQTKSSVKRVPEGEIGISADVVESILKRLSKFENSKRFLEPDLTIGKMARMCNSNTKYVSRIIMHYKNK